jgi:hypothetical protein
MHVDNDDAEACNAGVPEAFEQLYIHTHGDSQHQQAIFYILTASKRNEKIELTIDGACKVCSIPV